MREKIVDLHIAAAAATRAGFVQNTDEIIEQAEEQIRKLISPEHEA